MVLGGYEELEELLKRPGRKSKTVLYWMRQLSEAGVDWTDVERLSGDRAGWRKILKNRMEYLGVWEEQKGRKYEWGEREEVLERNERRVQEDSRCRYEGCGKVCRSKGSLVAHERKMHRAVEERVRFECGRCRGRFETSGARINHMRSCEGEVRKGIGESAIDVGL